VRKANGLGPIHLSMCQRVIKIHKNINTINMNLIARTRNERVEDEKIDK
jgi:hypothetical protein